MKKYRFSMGEQNNVSEIGVGGDKATGIFVRIVFDKPVVCLPGFTLEIEEKGDTCPHGYPPTIRCSRCGE